MNCLIYKNVRGDEKGDEQVWRTEIKGTVRAVRQLDGAHAVYRVVLRAVLSDADSWDERAIALLPLQQTVCLVECIPVAGCCRLASGQRRSLRSLELSLNLVQSGEEIHAATSPR